MRSSALLLVLTAGLLSVRSSQASVVLKLDEVGLTRAADAVVVGEVLDSRSEWNEVHTLIWTLTRVRVDDVAKGTPARGGVVTVREVGGRVGDVEARMIGAPEFVPGERVVLFLEHAPGGASFRTVALSEGKLVVSRGPDGRAVATSAARGLAFAGQANAMWDAGPVDLEVLLTTVRGHAAEPRP